MKASSLDATLVAKTVRKDDVETLSDVCDHLGIHGSADRRKVRQFLEQNGVDLGAVDDAADHPDVSDDGEAGVSGVQSDAGSGEVDGAGEDADGSVPSVGPVTDSAVSFGELSTADVRQHYRRIESVMQTLGESDGRPAAVFATNFGWYRESPVTDIDRLEDLGAKQATEKRLRTVDDYQDTVRETTGDSAMRSMYATISYTHAVGSDTTVEYTPRDGDGEEAVGEAMPSYGQLHGHAPYIDVDFASSDDDGAEFDVKKARAQGELDDDDRHRIRTLAEEWVDCYASLVDVDHVYCLDSGGGFYVFIAPAAVAPVNEYLADRDDDRKAVMQRLRSELDSRVGEWNDGLREEYDTRGFFEADKVNSKNHQYKSPLSVHKRIDGVATPVDPEDPTPGFVPFEDVDADLVDDAVAWADGFTDTRHREAVSDLVPALFGQQDDEDDWRDVVDRVAENAADSGHTPSSSTVAGGTSAPALDEPPEDLPHCLEQGLRTRITGDGFDGDSYHDLNRKLGILAMNAGYSVSEAVDLFDPSTFDAHRLASGDRFDRSATRKGVEGAGEYTPPSPRTLFEDGVLDVPRCDCPMHFGSRDEDREDVDRANQWIETCSPPDLPRTDIDIDSRREAMHGRLFDAFLDSSDLSVWAHNPGEGKTTTSAKAAADRGEKTAVFLPSHENAREFQRDDAKPDGFVHLKGAGQPRLDVCMDAQVAADDDETPECDQHAHPSRCPSMCPVYDLDADHPKRKLYDALAERGYARAAHAILGLADEDWHPETCAWLDQFDGIESVDRIVTVHNYLQLSTVWENRTAIVDDMQSGLGETLQLSEEYAKEVAQSFRRTAQWAEREYAADDSDDADKSDAEAEDKQTRVTHALHRLAAFLETAWSKSEAAECGDGWTPRQLDAPDLHRKHKGRWGTPTTVPDRVPEDAVESVQSRIYGGQGSTMEGGQYRVSTFYEAVYDDVAETLSEAVRAHYDRLVSDIRRGEYGGERLDVRLVLALFAAAADGEDAEAARIAAQQPVVVDNCQRCGGNLANVNGRLQCETCLWTKDSGKLVHGQSPARIATSAQTSDAGITDVKATVMPNAGDLPEAGRTLVLDATARKRVLAATFDVDEYRVSVRGGEDYKLDADVTQFINGQYHAGTVERGDGTRDRLQSFVDRVTDVHDNPLFISPHRLQYGQNRIEFPDTGEDAPAADVLHYGGLRGLNREDADAVVCIGAPHPPVVDLQRQARAMAATTDARVGGREFSNRDSDAVEPPVYRKYKYRDEDADSDADAGRAAATKTFSGLTGELFRQHRGDELEQAVHRIRPLLDSTPGQQSIYLVTNVPTGVPVDRLSTLDSVGDSLLDALDIRDTAEDVLLAMADAHADEDGDLSATKSDWKDTVAATVDSSARTVGRVVDDLRDAGLVEDGEYVQDEGRQLVLADATLSALAERL